jgi:hypothetical protein
VVTPLVSSSILPVSLRLRPLILLSQPRPGRKPPGEGDAEYSDRGVSAPRFREGRSYSYVPYRSCACEEDEIGWWALYCACAFAHTDLVLGGCEEEEEAEGPSEASLMNSGNSSMEPRIRGLRVSVRFGLDCRRAGGVIIRGGREKGQVRGFRDLGTWFRRVMVASSCAKYHSRNVYPISSLLLEICRLPAMFFPGYLDFVTEK